MPDAAVVAFAEHCPGITSEDLAYCGNMPDLAVVALAEHCPGLTSVSQRFCGNMTDEAVEVLAGTFQAPPRWSRGYENMTDAAIMALAEH